MIHICTAWWAGTSLTEQLLKRKFHRKLVELCYNSRWHVDMWRRSLTYMQVSPARLRTSTSCKYQVVHATCYENTYTCSTIHVTESPWTVVKTSSRGCAAFSLLLKPRSPAKHTLIVKDMGRYTLPIQQLRRKEAALLAIAPVNCFSQALPTLGGENPAHNGMQNSQLMLRQGTALVRTNVRQLERIFRRGFLF